MLAPIASDTRSPFNASSETSAWSRGERQAGGDQDGAELVAVEVGDVGLVVDARPADVHRRGVLDDTFFFGVAVEPDDRAQPAGDRGAGLAAVFEVAGEALDVDAADVEQAVVVLPAPGGELAQVQGVGVAGEAAVGGQEPEQRHPLDVGQHRLVPRDSSGGSGHGACLLAVVAGDPTTASRPPAGGSNRRYARALRAASDEMPFGTRRLA